MTTITPEHNSGICHAASENRRRVLERLKELAYQLENCDKEEPQENIQEKKINKNVDKNNNNFDYDDIDDDDAEGGCYTLCAAKIPCKIPERSRSRGNNGAIYDGGGHVYQNKYNQLDPKKAPTAVFPNYPKPPPKPVTPPERLRFDLERTKSRALIGGVLVTGCDCVRRNGLQDRCKRTECQGRPECMTRPEPTCAPSLGPMNLTREELAEKKSIPKPYLKLCCKCPPDCYKSNQQEEC